MPGFVSAPSTPEPEAPDTIQNDGWWPDISLTLLRQSVRLDQGSLTDERVRAAAVDAIAHVNTELTAWRALRNEEGAANLAAVVATQIGGESRLVGLYRRAVHSMTAATIARPLRDVGSTAAGHDRADALELAAGEHLRDARWAISDLQGKPRVTVELI